MGRLAKNIYGSGARFIFELLQNADDNRFTRARAQGQDPYVSFNVYSDRVIVDCNEDGFTESDLTALCAVGESSKSGSHGYIGAKGIGFKSVFIVAWKVHVISNHFRFSFQHKPGDVGLGMVTPEWDDKDLEEDLPPPNVTRFTLHLHTEPKASESIQQNIQKQLRDLQPSCLLFLRNLRRVKISHYTDSLSSPRSWRVFQKRAPDGLRTCLLESNNSELSGRTQEKHYHVTTYRATGLSPSANRETHSNEPGQSTASEADVVLAFPLLEDSVPLIQQQQIFAFLPVRESKFNVSLLHSNSQRNRESWLLTCMHSSSYNQTLTLKPVDKTS